MVIEVKFNVGKSLATHAVYQMSTSEGQALGEDTAFQSFVPGFDPHGHRRRRRAIGIFFPAAAVLLRLPSIHSATIVSLSPLDWRCY